MPALDPQSLPRHLDRLYRAAWALCGSPHDAEDLVQETFARVLARPRVLRGQDELAYLMQVLRNTFLTQRRTAARRPRVSSAALADVEPVDPSTGGRPEEAVQAREVITTIAELSENHRLALVAVDIVGLSYREAASILDTREATIATRVFRAREQVARELAGDRSRQVTERPKSTKRPQSSELPASVDLPTTTKLPASERRSGLDGASSTLAKPPPSAETPSPPHIPSPALSGRRDRRKVQDPTGVLLHEDPMREAPK